jgi:hypothetical protein
MKILNVLTYLVLRDRMSKKHFEKIMSRRGKRVEKAVELLEQHALADQQPEPLYIDAKGNIDWAKLAKHVREATSGR